MKLIDKDAVVAVIDKLKGKVNDISSFSNGWQQETGKFTTTTK